MDAYSKPEILALLGAARAESESDWLMLAVTFLYGLRVSEVLALTPDNIVGDCLDVRRRKGSKRTKQPLHASANPLLSVREPLIAFSRKAMRRQRLFPISQPADSALCEGRRDPGAQGTHACSQALLRDATD